MSKRNQSCVVKWCGSPCVGNPHATPASARKWILRQRAAAKAVGDGAYGEYTIEDAETGAEIPIDPRPRCQVCSSVLLRGGTYCEVCEIDW